MDLASSAEKKSHSFFSWRAQGLGKMDLVSDAAARVYSFQWSLLPTSSSSSSWVVLSLRPRFRPHNLSFVATVTLTVQILLSLLLSSPRCLHGHFSSHSISARSSFFNSSAFFFLRTRRENIIFEFSLPEKESE